MNIPGLSVRETKENSEKKRGKLAASSVQHEEHSTFKADQISTLNTANSFETAAQSSNSK
jgi:hypothetical protein